MSSAWNLIAMSPTSPMLRVYRVTACSAGMDCKTKFLLMSVFLIFEEHRRNVGWFGWRARSWVIVRYRAAPRERILDDVWLFPRVSKTRRH